MDYEEMEKHRQAALAVAQADGPRYEAAKQAAFKELGKIADVIGLMTIFAAPRALASVARKAAGSNVLTRDLVAQYLDTYLDIIERDKGQSNYDKNGQIARTEDSVRKARALIDTWTFPDPVPAPLVRVGREYMAAFYGAPVSDEECDQWEPPRR